MILDDFRIHIEALGYEVDVSENIFIVHKYEDWLVTISTHTLHALDTKWRLPVSRELFDIVTRFAATPIAEREPNKQYRLKLSREVGLPQLSQTPFGMDETHIYLNKVTDDDGDAQWILNSATQTEKYQTIFTEEELQDIDESGLERVPVDEGVFT